MPAKLSEGRQARHTHSLATHGSRLTDGIGRRLAGLAQRGGAVNTALLQPLVDPTLTVYAPGDLRQFHTRASPAWAFDATGTLRQFATGELRVVPSPVGLPAALREPAATNLIAWSSAQDRWGLGGANQATVTPDAAIAPDGTLTADLVTRPAGGNTYLQTGTAGAAGTYAYSQFFKAGVNGTRVGMRISGAYPNRGDALFDLAAGSVVGVANGGTATGTAAKIEATPFPGWWRCYVVATLADALGGLLWSPCDATVATLGGWEGAGGVNPADVYAWGAQGEVGPFPTSPIPTVGAAASRSRDEIQLPIRLEPGQPHSQLIDFVLPYDQVAMNRLTGDNAIGLGITPGTGQFNVWNGVANPIATNPYVKGSRGRGMYAGDNLGRGISLNGGPVAGDAQTHPAVIRVLLAQQIPGSDSQAPLLYIHEFRTWRRRVPNEQLRLITGG